MAKAALLTAAILAFVAGAPLGAVVVFAVVAAPAVTLEVATTACVGALPATGPWRPPFGQPYQITSGFDTARLHPVYGTVQPHTGTDLAAQPAGAPVVAAAAGTVLTTGYTPRTGHVVGIDHGGGVSTHYAHLAGPGTVTVGAVVRVGQRIGTEGATGATTGTHLHFEVHVDGVPVDPEPFMLEHGAALTGTAVQPGPAPETQPRPVLPADGEGGVGFELPPAGTPRRTSLTNPPVAVPAHVEELYRDAADRHGLPWTLLAGVGMAETVHGARTATSTAGARGLMQFMPATFATYGVDGNGDGRVGIDDDADSIHSAANYLHASGATRGSDGVRRALYAYNHADWYVNDVLHYAHAYGGGLVLAEDIDCGTGAGAGDPDLPRVSDDRVATMLAFAADQVGDAYVLGGNGPDAWDCSSLTEAAMAAIGISAPRTAQAQRDWLALGNGFRVTVQDARRGDLVFYDSYLGPDTIGHVAIVWDPATQTTLEAANPALGVGHFSYADDTDRAVFEIWRLGSVTDHP